MSKNKYLSKDEIVKIIKYEFDQRLNSTEPTYKNYKEIHCICSSGGILSITPVYPKGAILILTFNRDESGDAIPLEWIQHGVDNNWFNLQKIVRIQYYEDLLDKIDREKNL